MDHEKTTNAILEQLNYIDNFIDDNNLNINFDLSAFADDEFIFADEEKKTNNNTPLNDLESTQLNQLGHLIDDNEKREIDLTQFPNLNNLPKFPVPPGAKSSLVEAGLNQTQIDLLSALIAQYQLVQQPEQQSANNFLHNDLDHIQSSHLPYSPHSNNLLNSFDFHLNYGLEPLNLQNRSGDNVPTHISLNGSHSHDLNNDLNNHIQHNQSRLNSIQNNSSSIESGTMDNDLDKRRRNTAASARFRIKKKLKEKQMEEKIQNLQELINKFESKIDSLELENKLLKKVINEQSGEKNDNELKLLKEKILNNR